MLICVFAGHTVNYGSDKNEVDAHALSFRRAHRPHVSRDLLKHGI